MRQSGRSRGQGLFDFPGEIAAGMWLEARTPPERAWIRSRALRSPPDGAARRTGPVDAKAQLVGGRTEKDADARNRIGVQARPPDPKRPSRSQDTSRQQPGWPGRRWPGRTPP